MKLLFIAYLFLSVTARAQYTMVGYSGNDGVVVYYDNVKWEILDTLGHPKGRFIGHHGKDSARHATIESIFDENIDSVKTFTTVSDEILYMDILGANVVPLHKTVRFRLFIEATTPNGHVSTDTKTIFVINRDGHCVIEMKHENYARQFGEETFHGADWNVGIPAGEGLIQVTGKGILNRKIIWRYLKLN